MAAEVAEDDSAETAQARIRELLDPDDPERDQIVARVAAAIGLTSAQVPVSELFWGIRRLFEALAADQPLIVLFDDIHDAAPTFLELLDHLVESSKRVPIVLVCSARHELLEQNPEWEGRPGTATIKLEPLTAADAELFIDRPARRDSPARRGQASGGRGRRGQPALRRADGPDAGRRARLESAGRT